VAVSRDSAHAAETACTSLDVDVFISSSLSRVVPNIL
jgi:hypothetical protein